MARLVSERTTVIYEVRCPHCRSTTEHTKRALVTVEIDASDNSIVDITLDCTAVQTGQDRT